LRPESGSGNAPEPCLGALDRAAAAAIVALCLLTVHACGYLRNDPLPTTRIEMSRNFQTALTAVLRPE
jgi:hypothetical protein